MKSIRLSAAALISSLALLAPASAAQYSFVQTGFTGGGTVTGIFEGTDLDSDGQIASFTGELTSFSVSFAGDSQVPDFTHSLLNVVGLVYLIGSGVLGDDPIGPYGEGLLSHGTGSGAANYAAGVGIHPNLTGGSVWIPGTNMASTTLNPVLVSEVPEPSHFALLLTGLIAVRLMRTRSGA